MPPVTMATCTVCKHPQRAHIDAYLGQRRVTYARAARRWPPLSADALIRHHRNHVGTTSGLTVDAAALPESDATPRERMWALIRQLESQSAGNPMRTDLTRELRLAYEAVDKLADHSPPETVSPAQVEGMDIFLRELAQALRPWPDASRAVAEIVLRRFPP